MIHKIFLLIAMAISLLLTATVDSSCATTSPTSAALGQEFTLAVGQSAAISGENITIKFVDVTGDSRCPRNVTCIWAGEVTCAVAITVPGLSTSNLTLIYPGLTSQLSEMDFNGYKLAFRVDPYPVAGKKIETNQYRLVMNVTKGAH